jgi:pimeloyl-ACP methyl ester carboxylesterase
MTRTGQLDPHSGKPIAFDLPSGTIAALRAGADGDPDVLLVPGYTGSKEDFVPILDDVAGAGFRVTSVDLPGQYESRGPDDPSRYTPGALARTLLELADELGGTPHLLGHSFGGLVARAAVIAAPHRFADLVLMSSGPSAIEGLRRERIDQLRPVLPQGLPGVWAAMQAAFLAEPGYVPPPPDLDQFLERRFLEGSPAMLVGMGDAITTEPDRVDELRATGVRTLVLYGQDDDAWPAPVQADMAERLGAQRVVIAHAAHSPAAENPRPTARALVEFWHASVSG